MSLSASKLCTRKSLNERTKYTLAHYPAKRNHRKFEPGNIGLVRELVPSSHLAINQQPADILF